METKSTTTFREWLRAQTTAAMQHLAQQLDAAKIREDATYAEMQFALVESIQPQMVPTLAQASKAYAKASVEVAQ